MEEEDEETRATETISIVRERGVDSLQDETVWSLNTHGQVSK